MGELQIKRRPSRSPQVGDMRIQISIYTRTMTAPTFGEVDAFSQGHTLIATVWSSIETVRPSRTFDGVDSDTKTTHEFKIRYRTDILSKNIIKYDGNSYKIGFVDDTDLRKRFLFLLCELLGEDSAEANR